MEHPQPTRVYVVSDSVGETGESVVRAAAMQFHPVPVEIVRAPFIHDFEGIDKVINGIRTHGGIVVFTLVIPELRDDLIYESETI
jgi:regulator of PEP synthase PpsR (kinase-PPPase family)